jgi:hypothetical protein
MATPYVILNLATTGRWRAKESKENVGTIVSSLVERE